MSILLATNLPHNLQRLGGLVNTNVVGFGFDPNYTPLLLDALVGSEAAWRTVFDAPLTDFHYQFRWRASTGGAGLPPSATNPTVRFDDPVAGRPLLRLAVPTTAANQVLQYWNGAAWVTIGLPLILTSGAHYIHTVRCKIAAVGGLFEWRVGGVVQAAFAGDTEALLGGTYSAQWATHGTGPCGPFDTTPKFAEVILTTGDESPVGMRVRSHLITGAGTDQEWSGPPTAIDEAEVSTADVVSSDTPGQVATYTMDDLPVALGANVVRALQLSAYARRGGTGPQSIQLAVRTNGGLHVAPAQALTTGYQAIRHMFEGNPATTEEFTAAEIDALEPGMASGA